MFVPQFSLLTETQREYIQIDRSFYILESKPPPQLN